MPFIVPSANWLLDYSQHFLAILLFLISIEYDHGDHRTRDAIMVIKELNIFRVWGPQREIDQGIRQNVFRVVHCSQSIELVERETLLEKQLKIYQLPQVVRTLHFSPVTRCIHFRTHGTHEIAVFAVKKLTNLASLTLVFGG